MYEGAGAYKYNTFMKSTCSHDLDIELVTSDIPRGSGQILIPAVISPMYIFKIVDKYVSSHATGTII